MRKEAVDQARLAASRAERALRCMLSAETQQEAEEAWEDFLHAYSRIYEKLKAGARGHDSSWQWYSKVAQTRKNDELLCYLLHARNSDHHRLEKIVEVNPGGIGIGATGSIYIKSMTVTPDGVFDLDWEPSSPGSQLVIELISAHLKAADVIDRGVIYKAPTSHLDLKLPDQKVSTIARLACEYAEQLLEKVPS